MSSTLVDPRVKLRHIAAFLEIHRQGGVVRAGEVLGLSQPAVSRAVAELEDILGVALFDRTRRKLTLTGFGELFLRHATTAMSALREGVDSVASRSGAPVVRLGALPSVEVEIVPRAVARFVAGALACRVHVESGPSPHLLALLRAGELDFCVGRMPQPGAMSGLSFEHLYAEDLVLAVRPDHPALQDPAPDMRVLERHTVLMPPVGAIIRPTLDTLLLTHGVGRIPQEIETVSNSFARSYTLMTDAIWVISRSVVRSEFARGDLVALGVNTVTSHGAVGITSRAGAESSLQARGMIEAIRAESTGDAEGPPESVETGPASRMGDD